MNLPRKRIACAACGLLASAVQAQSPANDPDFELDASSLPVVITPTRLRQSLAEVPASVTVITAETIRRYGITTVAETMRLVPGMAVLRADGNDWRISYHGTNVLIPRRMNVLVDGISVYRPAFSEVIWSRLPVAIDDIDRIEVTRGPNSAAYGPNSFLAVVNIITRHPKDVERAHASLVASSRSAATLSVRGAWSIGATALSLGASATRDPGYDTVSQDPAGHDGQRVQRLSLRAQTSLSPWSSLMLDADLVRGTYEVPYIDQFQQSYPDREAEDLYVGATWTTQVSESHEVQLRLNHSRQRDDQSWRTCLPTVTLLPQMFDLWAANPAYANALLAGQLPIGGSPADDALALAALAAIRALGSTALAPTCVTGNQDAVQTRTEVELQDTRVFSDRWRLVWGLGARHQDGDSQTFLGGRRSADVQWVFGNVEARPLPALTLNAGGYAERHSLAPSTFSPRVAANWRLSPRQALRLVVSHGTRSPDIYEQRADWTYTFTGAEPPLAGASTVRWYQSQVAPGDLRSERIRSTEVGYLLNLPRRGLLLDVKLFHDRLSRLISERTNLAGGWASNDHSVTLSGAEVQASMQWSPRTSGFAHYAYLENRDATSLLERSQYSRHSGGIGASHDLGDGWRMSAAYYGASGDGIGQSDYGRTDLLLSRSGSTDGVRWDATLGVRRLDTPKVSYTIGGNTLWSRFDERSEVFVRLNLRLP